MKRIFSRAAALLMVALLLVSTMAMGLSAAPERKQVTAIEALSAPVIDGKIDDMWEKTEAVEILNFGSNIYGNTSTPEAHEKNPVATASIKLMWDEAHLYVLGVVSDPTPNKTASAVGDEHIDGVDIQISEDNSTSGPMRDDTQGFDNTLPANGNFNININGKATGWGGVWFADAGYEKVVSAAVDTADGYIFEAAIPLQTISGSVGTVIGVEFQINDNQDGSGRTAIRQWNADLCMAHSDAAYLGECKFIEAPAPVTEAPATEAPAAAPTTPAAPATADMGIIAACTILALSAGAVITAKKR